jgi:hypothetical protein
MVYMPTTTAVPRAPAAAAAAAAILCRGNPSPEEDLHHLKLLSHVFLPLLLLLLHSLLQGQLVT